MYYQLAPSILYAISGFRRGLDHMSMVWVKWVKELRAFGARSLPYALAVQGLISTRHFLAPPRF